MNSARLNLLDSYAYPNAFLCKGTSQRPVVLAMLFTCATSSAEGRLSTHSPVRLMFSTVWEEASRPIIQLHPSHQIDDIGAKFAVPSRFLVEIITTGVPKYRIAGSIVLCIIFLNR